MFSAEQPWPVVAQSNALHLATLGPPDPAEQPGPDTLDRGPRLAAAAGPAR